MRPVFSQSAGNGRFTPLHANHMEPSVEIGDALPLGKDEEESSTNELEASSSDSPPLTAPSVETGDISPLKKDKHERPNIVREDGSSGLPPLSVYVSL
jgi:hypothetical protein